MPYIPRKLTKPAPFRRPSIDVHREVNREWQNVRPGDLAKDDTVANFGKLVRDPETGKQFVDRYRKENNVLIPNPFSGVVLTNVQGRSQLFDAEALLFAFTEVKDEG